MLLFTQLSPAQNESSKTNNTLINKYIEKVQSRFSGANNIPNFTTINRLNQNIEVGTDSIVQQFNFNPFFNEIYSTSYRKLENYELKHSSHEFITDLGLEISMSYNFDITIHGTFFNNNTGLPDSLKVEFSGPCINNTAAHKFHYFYDNNRNISSCEESENYQLSYIDINSDSKDSDCFVSVDLSNDFLNKQEANNWQKRSDWTYNDQGLLEKWNFYDAGSEVLFNFEFDNDNNIVYRSDSIFIADIGALWDAFQNEFQFSSNGELLQWTRSMLDLNTKKWNKLTRQLYSYLDDTGLNYNKTIQAYSQFADEWYDLRIDSCHFNKDQNCKNFKYYVVSPETAEWYCISESKHYLSATSKSLQLSKSLNVQTETEKRMVISPNPCNTGYLKIDLTNDFIPNKYQLINLQGTVVQSERIDGTNNQLTINVENVPSGMYFLSVSDRSNKIYNSKILINTK